MCIEDGGFAIGSLLIAAAQRPLFKAKFVLPEVRKLSEIGEPLAVLR